MDKSQIKQIKDEIKEKEELLAKGEEAVMLSEAIKRLEKNKDFQMVILDKFIEKECARQTRLAVDPDLEERLRPLVISGSQAAGHLMIFMKHMHKFAEMARYNVEPLEKDIEELNYLLNAQDGE